MFSKGPKINSVHPSKMQRMEKTECVQEKENESVYDVLGPSLGVCLKHRNG